ncbi:MAG: tetratricopeptide repeat protein [Deltaproteobacteria bacterium]|nr:tetratricopeptide repeat protein [Deltaproteobacteria bacterium]
MKTKNVGFVLTLIVAVFVFVIPAWSENKEVAVKDGPKNKQGYKGSVSCRECHERFYKLWAPSRHGLAMQPYSADFARGHLSEQTKEIRIGDDEYQVRLKEGVMVEKGSGDPKTYPIKEVLGGKNVYYFLTPFEKGRLQTLPLAYDVNRKEWFDMAASGVRHIEGRNSDEPLNWKDWHYTFNTACYSCHVSQLSTNYNLETDTYHTTWTEPGINCETCHGPGEEHIRVCKEAPKGTIPKDLKTIRGGRSFTHEQNNANCVSCHAKAVTLTPSFMPGDIFWDHFDLATLEHSDYYPDGRDLGENYTFTSWLMSPCAKSGQLDCLHCHTSSGRFRQKDHPNDACMPCHQDKVANSPAHSMHKRESPGNRCISCHMPMTTFAHMNRSDHSMLPPSPAASIQFGSPNACNNCHTEKDAAWTDKLVRQWRKRDYQAPILHRAGLIQSARKGDWTRLAEMLAHIQDKNRDPVFAASLIRLIPPDQDPSVEKTLVAASKDPSPLVRAAATEALGSLWSGKSFEVLLEKTKDPTRLVRIRAASGLAKYPRKMIPEAYGDSFEKATHEYFSAIMVRPDQWTSHYNMGNYHLNRNELEEAIGSYNLALKREPKAVMAMVNSSMAHARMGQKDEAEASLRKALETAPKNAATLYNMGLLKAEQNNLQEAESYLRKAFQEDPSMAQAAYNLCIIASQDRMEEAINWCRKAQELRPREPKYAYTLAYYQNQMGNTSAAVKILDDLVNESPTYSDAIMLLGFIYEKQGNKDGAVSVYEKALSNDKIPRIRKKVLMEKLDFLKSSEKD